MRTIEELNKKNVPIIRIDESLDFYDNVDLFPEKSEKANQMLETIGLPKLHDSSTDKITILFVDDEENNLYSFKSIFRIKYHILTATTGYDALKTLEKNKVHIIITDQDMPEMTGVDFLEKALLMYPDVMRVLLAEYANIKVVIDAINKGKIFHYLSKPWNEEELTMTINRAYEAYLEKIELDKISDSHLKSLYKKRFPNPHC